VAIAAFFRSRLSSEDLGNEVRTRIYPNDLDLNLHVNNGRYLTLCDLGRVDMFVRSRLAHVMLRNKWIPVVTDVTMSFIKPLRLFDRIRIVSVVSHWDDKYFYSSHKIYRADTLVSEGTSKALIVSRGSGRLAPAEVVEAVNSYVRD